jgi:hypothetical protein
LLLPLVILALPVLFIACLIFGINLLRGLGAALASLAGFRGARVRAENPGTRVFVKIRGKRVP